MIFLNVYDFIYLALSFFFILLVSYFTKYLLYIKFDHFKWILK